MLSKKRLRIHLTVIFMICLPALCWGEAFPSMGYEDLQQSFSSTEQVDKSEVKLRSLYKDKKQKNIIKHHFNVVKSLLRHEKLEFSIEEEYLVVTLSEKRLVKFRFLNETFKSLEVNGIEVSVGGTNYLKDFESVNYALSFSAASLIDLMLPKAKASNYNPGQRVLGGYVVLLAVASLSINIDNDLDFKP